MKDKKREYYLGIAGYTIKLNLLPTEYTYYKEKLAKEIEEVWGNGGFITKKNKPDFEIEFKSVNSFIQLIQKEKGKKHYYLTFERDFKKRIFKTNYYISLSLLSIALREIVTFLLLGEGFLVHASSVMDKKGNFYIFMARSGEGKTTVSNLISQDSRYEKVSDDSVVVKKVGTEWLFYSSFIVEKGEKPSFNWTKKANIFFIKKGKKAKRQKLSKDVLKTLLGQLWLAYNKVDEKTLKLAMEFTNDKEFYKLTTSLDKKDLIAQIK